MNTAVQWVLVDWLSRASAYALQNGLLSALPYIGFWLTIVLSGQLADIVRARGWLTTTQTRKVGNSLGKVQVTLGSSR